MAALFSRNAGRFDDGREIHLPALYCGDMGAVTGPAMITMVCDGYRNAGRLDSAFILSASDGGQRATALVSTGNVKPLPRLEIGGNRINWDRYGKGGQ